MPDKEKMSGSCYVLRGAKFQCDQGSVPNFIETTNQKVFVQNKPIVTIDDKIFKTPVGPFGQCKLNTSQGQPCVYANGEWDEETCIDHGKMVVLDSSCMYCSVFKPQGGKITCIDSGQKKEEASSSDDSDDKEKEQAEVAKMESLPNDLNSSKLELEPQNTAYFGVRQILYGENGSFVKKSAKKSDIKTLPKMRAAEYTFEAEPTSADAEKSELSWAISLIKNKKIERNNIVLFQSGGSPFSVELKKGLYCIEGFGNKRTKADDYYPIYMQKYIDFINKKKGCQTPPFDANASFCLNVTDNEIQTVTGPDMDGNDAEYKRGKVKYVRQSKEITFDINTTFPFDDKLDVMKCVIKNESDQEIPSSLFHLDAKNGKLKFTPMNVETKYIISLSLYKIEDGVCSLEPVSTYEFSSFCLYDKVCLKSEPNDEFLRPGTCICLSLILNNANNYEGLKDAEWTVTKDEKAYDVSKNQTADATADTDIDELESSFVVNKWSRFMMCFKEEGFYVIKASFKGLRTSGDKPFAERTVLVTKNHVTGLRVTATNGIRYVGLKYQVTPTFKFGNNIKLEDGKVTTNFTNNQTHRLTDSLPLCMNKAGSYKITVRLDNTAPYEMTVNIVDAKAEIWEFCNSKKESITQIGKTGTFGVHLYVPAWANTNTPSKKVTFTFYEYDISGKTVNQIRSILPVVADVDKDGEVYVKEVKIETKDLCAFADKNHRIYFVVSDAPLEKISGITKSKYGKGILKSRVLLRVLPNIDVNGSFADQEGNRLVDILKYGDVAYAKLRLTNVTDDELKKLKFRLYENKYGWDSMVYECALPNPDVDGDVLLEIPTNAGNLSEADHEGSEEIPRLFYFRIEKESFVRDSVLLTYPSVPGDLYSFNIQKNQTQLSAELAKEGKGESHDGQILSQTRSYIYQLKLAKKVEDSEYRKTYQTLAPVIVGENKNVKSIIPRRCLCPNCHESADALLKRLEKIFDKCDKSDLKIVAKTYTENMYKFRLDTCWIKAHFFAQVLHEMGNGSLRKEESCNFSAEALFNGHPNLTAFRSKWDKCRKFGRILSVTDLPEKYQDEKERHEANCEAIANMAYNKRNGNKEAHDGWDYRGRGLLQLTGRDAYESVGLILKRLGFDKKGINCDLLNPAVRDTVASDLELSTLASMAFLRYKNADMYKLCNGIDRVHNVSSRIGTNEPEKRQRCFDGKNEETKVGTKDKSKKTEVENKGTSFVFDVHNCKYDKVFDANKNGRISYHAFSNGHIEKHIPKDVSDIDHYDFYCHTDDGLEVYICTREILKINKLYYDKKIKASIPKGTTFEERKENGVSEEWEYNSNTNINGKTIYIMNDGSKIVLGKDGSCKKYSADKESSGVCKETELVKMDEDCTDGLLQFDKDGVRIYYQIDLDQTQRVYCNPNTFAILLGILAELGKEGIRYSGTGNVEIHGTGFPSVSHFNGMALDFSYKSAENDNHQSKNVEKDNKLLSIGYLFACPTMLVGKKKIRIGINACGAIGNSFHEDHIHLGPFNSVLNMALEINEK